MVQYKRKESKKVKDWRDVSRTAPKRMCRDLAWVRNTICNESPTLNFKFRVIKRVSTVQEVTVLGSR